MHIYRAQQDITATASEVWNALANVTVWPEWLPTVLEVQPLAGQVLSVGAKFKIIQPKLRPTVWEVTELHPGENFAWQASSPGLMLWANHTVVELPDRRSEVLLEFRFSGILAPLIALLAGSVTKRYLAIEVASIKRRAEVIAGREA
ncbi:MAG: SRPBCC family protein [Candidatus Competibacter sp.]